jgi:purine-binding chemotaxis protein CheW
MYVLTFILNKAQLALPVDNIQEILLEQEYVDVPLAPKEIKGLFSLRGQVITALDLRTKLGLPEKKEGRFANIIIKIGEEQFSLIVDEIGEVVLLQHNQLEPLPSNLRVKWGKWSSTVFRINSDLILLLNLMNVLETTTIVV